MGDMQGQEQFFRATMRYFAAQRETRPLASDSALPFPKDWFDLPPQTMADFGAAFYLAGLTRYHRKRSLADVMAALEPPLRLGQYRIFYAGGYPRAVATWAGLDAAGEYRFAVDHLPLAPQDWNAGAQVWLVDMIAPFGHVEQIVPMMAQNPEVMCVRTLHHNREGTRYRILEWARAAAGTAYEVRSFGVGQFKRRLQEAGL